MTAAGDPTRRGSIIRIRSFFPRRSIACPKAPRVGTCEDAAESQEKPFVQWVFRFVLTRFLLIIPTVFILVTIVFFVMRATGDPISAAMGGRLTPEELQRRIHAAGYDRPLVVQYLDYLGGLLRGDLAPRSPTTSRSPPS